MSLQDALSAVAAAKHTSKKKGKPQASKRGKGIPPAFLKGKGAPAAPPNPYARPGS